MPRQDTLLRRQLVCGEERVGAARAHGAVVQVGSVCGQCHEAAPDASSRSGGRCYDSGLRRQVGAYGGLVDGGGGGGSKHRGVLQGRLR